MIPDLRKPSRTARKLEQRKVKLGREKTERENKAASRRRDKFRCRFPLCGCTRLKLKLDARLEQSHDKHKGMGGNPAGDRSLTEGLVTLCLHRHQDGIVSRHKGTLRTEYLTDRKNDGPVIWMVDRDVFFRDDVLTRIIVRDVPFDYIRDGFVEVAREKDIQQLELLLPWQRITLEQLAEMLL